MVQLIVWNGSEVDEHAAAAMAALEPAGLLWPTYPKRHSQVKTDISRNTGWAVMANKSWRPDRAATEPQPRCST